MNYRTPALVARHGFLYEFISGRPARAAALETLIRRAQAMDGVWVAAGDEIAAWVAGLDLPPVTHEPPRF